MSAIQSSVGLITGIPIQDTVDQLMAIAARPRDTLEARTAEIASEKSAVDTLASLVLSLQFSANKFKSPSTFGSRSATSSSTAVTATVPPGASPAPGSYRFTPLQAASAHQWVSGSFDDIADAVGGGELRLGFGGQVDRGLDLGRLNAGAGVASGSIRITDRTGATATVDLRAARTVDDVLLAINSSPELGVTATTDGDAFVLTDTTGGGGTLSVADVGLTKTASDLGLAGGAAPSSVLTGGDVLALHRGTKLDQLNDGAGVRVIDGQDDLTITPRDGSAAFGVDLAGATTVGGVLDAINGDADNAGRVTASIAPDGRRLVLTDQTGAANDNLVVANGLLGAAADDLGLAADEASGVLTGGRLISGLQDTLVSSLNGGAGFTLGRIAVTDRGGVSFTTDLTGLETIGDVVRRINQDAAGAGANLAARINDSRTGIAVDDYTASPTGNLVIAEVDGGTTAADLGLAADAASAAVDGGSLSRQTVSESTPLSSLRGGAGVALNDFAVTDSNGVKKSVDLDKAGDPAETVGDVIERINTLSVGVTASINSTGDGLLLTDTAGGAGTLTVSEVGGGASAAHLGLLGASTTANGSGQQTIDGSTRHGVDLSDLTASADSISLATLNGGLGVDKGIFLITPANDSADSPQAFAVNLGTPGDEAFTVGDVIQKINQAADDAGVAVTAAVNSEGTGIELTDSTGGSGGLKVEDLGSGTAAADLRLTTAAKTLSGGGQAVNGSGLFSAAEGELGALQTLVGRINGLSAGFTASVFQDASGYRLAIAADTTGSANQLAIDAGGTGLSFQETSRAADGVALFGASTTGGAVAVTSEDSRFDGVVEGLNLTVTQATGETAVIDVAKDDEPFTSAVQDFVDAYNSVRSNLDEVASFDETTNSTGILFGRLEALRVDSDLSRLISGRLRPGATYGSLESVGVSLGDDGTLAIDSAKLNEALAADPAGVEDLFTDDQNGLVTRLQEVVDGLAAGENALLSSRSDALSRTIEVNESRVEGMNETLAAERNRLLLEFFRLEETIALLQSNLDTVGGIQPITFASSSSSSGGGS